ARRAAPPPRELSAPRARCSGTCAARRWRAFASSDRALTARGAPKWGPTVASRSTASGAAAAFDKRSVRTADRLFTLPELDLDGARAVGLKVGQRKPGLFVSGAVDRGFEMLVRFFVFGVRGAF